MAKQKRHLKSWRDIWYVLDSILDEEAVVEEVLEPRNNLIRNLERGLGRNDPPIVCYTLPSGHTIVGNQRWFLIHNSEGNLDSIGDQPAVRTTNAREWYRNGVRHRINGPAYCWSNSSGTKKWRNNFYINGDYQDYDRIMAFTNLPRQGDLFEYQDKAYVAVSVEPGLISFTNGEATDTRIWFGSWLSRKPFCDLTEEELAVWNVTASLLQTLPWAQQHQKEYSASVVG